MNLQFLNPPRRADESARRTRARKALDILAQAKAASASLADNRWVVWVEMHHRMDQALSEDSLLGFQSHPDLGPQITGGSGRHFLDLLERECGGRQARRLLNGHQETDCGQPRDLVVERGKYITVTSMRHLYHLGRIGDQLPLCFAAAPDVVEIGGGFGNLARMTYQAGQCRRYFIVDHPVLLAIQYFFLTEFFSPEQVAVCAGPQGYIQGDARSAIQLFSAFAADELPRHLTDPYAVVSTMALTEIPREGQDQYLSLLDPRFIYVFGQLENRTVGGGRSAENVEFSNRELVFTLGERFHTLDYQFHGYHFEYLGRAFEAPYGERI